MGGQKEQGEKKNRPPGDSYRTTQQGTDQEVKKGIQSRER